QAVLLDEPPGDGHHDGLHGGAGVPRLGGPLRAADQLRYGQAALLLRPLEAPPVAEAVRAPGQRPLRGDPRFGAHLLPFLIRASEPAGAAHGPDGALGDDDRLRRYFWLHGDGAPLAVHRPSRLPLPGLDPLDPAVMPAPIASAAVAPPGHGLPP